MVKNKHDYKLSERLYHMAEGAGDTQATLLLMGAGKLIEVRKDTESSLVQNATQHLGVLATFACASNPDFVHEVGYESVSLAYMLLQMDLDFLRGLLGCIDGLLLVAALQEEMAKNKEADEDKES